MSFSTTFSVKGDPIKANARGTIQEVAAKIERSGKFHEGHPCKENHIGRF